MLKRIVKNKKVLLTGGHAASSALVVAEEIIKQKKPWDIYWIGFRQSVEGERISTLSSIYFPKYGIKTYGINAGRIQTKWSIQTIPSLLKIPVGFIHARILLSKIKPNIILSFGGFSAFPVVVIGYFMGIPIILHEQTSVVGRANKYSSLFAKKIAVSRETSVKYFPKNKVVITGNPIPFEIEKNQNQKILFKKPIIFITGGQSGSVAINSAIEKILPKLLLKFKVVHLTGLKEEGKFKDVRNNLNQNMKKNYEVYGIVDPGKYNQLFNSSSILISRAGANTVSKIIVAEKPAILIPLPISYLNEQEKNAVFASHFSGARILDQDKLNPEDIIREIEFLRRNWNKINKKIKNYINPDIGASEKIVSLIQKYIK